MSLGADQAFAKQTKQSRLSGGQGRGGRGPERNGLAWLPALVSPAQLGIKRISHLDSRLSTLANEWSGLPIVATPSTGAQRLCA